MHSRVFEISTEPIPKDERREYLPDWFEQSYDYCDYVCLIDDESEQMADIEWLCESHNDRQVVFTKEEIAEHMTQMFHEFREALDGVNHITHEAFTRDDYDAYYAMYKLKQSFEDKHGFWFYLPDREDMYTQESFYRKFGAGTYYIGSVWDYHF